MTFSIRPGTTTEAARLSDLAFRSKAHWGYSDAFMEACREELTYAPEDIENLDVAVAEDDGRVVGFYALARLSATEVELEAMFVDPDVIGRGYGRRLMDHALRAATAGGAHAMVIQGDPNAEPFYLAMGGTITGTRESDSIPGRYLPTFRIALRS